MHVFVALAFIWSATCSAQEVHMLGDLTPKENNQRGSNPSSYVTYKGNTYFFATANNAGTTLWRTDGTTAGTSLVYAFGDGSFMSQSNAAIVYKDLLYFSVSTPTLGYELWRTDGTSGGTELFKEIYPGQWGSSPYDFCLFKDKLFFTATNHASGRELWQTDGTTAGTTVFDLKPGSQSSSPNMLRVSGSKMYFKAGVTGVTGNSELWMSDGTLSGTSNFIRINELSRSSYVNDITPYEGGIYFTARDRNTSHQELWISNGTIAGTKKILRSLGKTFFGPTRLQMLNGKLTFVQSTYDYGVELWQSDGTEQGSKILIDLEPGNQSGLSLNQLKIIGNHLYFLGRSGTNAYEIWRTDGTTNGTNQVTNFSSSSSGFNRVSQIGEGLNGYIYFTAMDFAGDAELWYTDGTINGTKFFKEINPEASGRPFNFFTDGNLIYFTGIDGVHGFEPWVCDGTDEGTVMLKNINTRTEDSHPRGYHGIGDKVVFAAIQNGVFTIIGSDGTAENTQALFHDVDQDSIPTMNIPQFVSYKGGCYFNAATPKYGQELWYTDGTTENTYMFKDIMKGSSNSSPALFNVMDDVLYFRAQNTFWGQAELYRTKGTPETTKRVKSLWGETRQTTMNAMVNAKHKLYYVMFTQEDGREIYVSDGTEQGSRRIKDICPGTCSGSNIVEQTAVDGSRVFFSANDNDHGLELWVTDGTEKGTKMVVDINLGVNSSNPQFFGKLNGRVIFSAGDAVHGRELWTTDGTTEGTKILKDILPGGSSSNPIRGVRMGDLMYFSAYTGVHGMELWQTDGTEEGTKMVVDVYPGIGHSSPQYLTALNDTLYFVANHEAFGQELWKYHPSMDTAQLVADIIPGVQTSRPHMLTVVGNRLYFTATHDQYGVEAFYLEDPNYTPPQEEPAVEDEIKPFILFPNPTNDQITLKWDNPRDQEYHMVIYDLVGKPIVNRSTRESQHTFDVSHLASGTYVAELKGVGVIKFIKY